MIINFLIILIIILSPKRPLLLSPYTEGELGPAQSMPAHSERPIGTRALTPTFMLVPTLKRQHQLKHDQSQWAVQSSTSNKKKILN